MKVTSRTRATLITIAIVVFGITGAESYDRWSVNDDATNCGYCHGDFRNGNYVSPVDGQNWGNLHNIHRTDMLSSDCATCHYQPGNNDEFPVLLNLSGGGDGLDPIGCMGCHGVDPQDPLHPNGWGAGLRAHHTNANVGPDANGKTCASAGCHANDPAPQPEDTLPAYYLNPGNNHPNMPTDPCNPVSAGYPESFAGEDKGLDNDGDGFYDEIDPDCGGGPTPTPVVPTPTNTPTATATPALPTPTPTNTPTPAIDPDLIFDDGFESGGTLGWTSATRMTRAGLDYARNLGGRLLTTPTVFLMVLTGVALVGGMPGIRERRRRRKKKR